MGAGVFLRMCVYVGDVPCSTQGIVGRSRPGRRSPAFKQLAVVYYSTV